MVRATTGGGAFEVDGRAEALGFFLGAMFDGAAEDEDGDEDDALLTLSGSRKRSPYLVHQRCHGKPRPPMGPRAPCLFSRGDVVLHKEQRNVVKRDSNLTGSFTQVRAVVRRKTLLLLWWIDGGKMVMDVIRLPGRVASGLQWLHVYGCVCDLISSPANLLSNSLTPPTVALGLLL